MAGRRRQPQRIAQGFPDEIVGSLGISPTCAQEPEGSSSWIVEDNGVPKPLRGTYSQSEDAVLAQRLAAGDDAALFMLMDRYSAPLLHYILRMVGNCDLAEEILQQVMFEAGQQSYQIQPDTHLKTWMFRLARRLTHRRFSGGLVPLQAGGTADSGISAIFPSYRQADHFLPEAVSTALSNLPLDCREILELRFFQQFSGSEIALILDLSNSAVEIAHNRAMEQLVEALESQ